MSLPIEFNSTKSRVKWSFNWEKIERELKKPGCILKINKHKKERITSRVQKVCSIFSLHPQRSLGTWPTFTINSSWYRSWWSRCHLETSRHWSSSSTRRAFIWMNIGRTGSPEATCQCHYWSGQRVLTGAGARNIHYNPAVWVCNKMYKLHTQLGLIVYGLSCPCYGAFIND